MLSPASLLRCAASAASTRGARGDRPPRIRRGGLRARNGVCTLRAVVDADAALRDAVGHGQQRRAHRRAAALRFARRARAARAFSARGPRIWIDADGAGARSLLRLRDEEMAVADRCRDEQTFAGRESASASVVRDSQWPCGRRGSRRSPTRGRAAPPGTSPRRALRAVEPRLEMGVAQVHERDFRRAVTPVAVGDATSMPREPSAASATSSLGSVYS